MSVGEITPSQTAGPYFSMRLAGPGENVLVSDPVDGERIRIDGMLIDGAGRPVEDGLIEMWQANGRGRYRHPDDDLGPDDAFTGFGRAQTSFTDGSFSFETIKPGPVPDPEGELQAPHLNVIIQGRGILRPYFTRVYFDDEHEANEHDLVLGMIPDDRRHTLIATKVGTTSDPTVYEITFRLQGPDETVFLSF